MDATVFTEIPSPIGSLRLVAHEGALIGLAMQPTRAPEAAWRRDDAAMRSFREQLQAYLAGELRRFTLPLAPRGTEFQQRVWQALTRLEFGETVSYGELARRVDQPGASRAVGSANNRNPIAIVVPCHRVVGADGRLVGFGGGLPRKQWLLRHEAELLAREFRLTAPEART